MFTTIITRGKNELVSAIASFQSERVLDAQPPFLGTLDTGRRGRAGPMPSSAIAACELEPDERETYSNGVRKAIYRDPDGHELGIGGPA